jgi:hypothetical protein
MIAEGDIGMRNKWLALIVCGLPLIAAEKNRDWQTGQVVESKALADPRDHAIASADKTYLVRGSVGAGDEALAIGVTVRFAVEDKNMFVSIAGKEYKLYVLGVRASVAKAAPAAPPAGPAPVAAVAPPAPVSPPAPKAAVVPPAPVAPVAPPAPRASQSSREPSQSQTAQEPTLDSLLDNDAIVKMIVGGLKEDTVIRVIEARPGKYALGPDALVALKTAGVPQSVIAAMSSKMRQLQR